MIPRIALLLSAVLLVNGCVFRTIQGNIESSSVHYNRALEKSENEMLLLNIVRSKERRPMYISGISKVTGSIKDELTLSATLPFSRYTDMTKTRVGTPGGTFNLNPNYDVNMLNTQDFMRGFLTPLDSKTLVFYWEQGWAPELLLYLFVGKVQEGNNPPKLNRPSVEMFVDFQSWVKNFVKSKPQVLAFKSCEKVGPKLDRKELGGLENLLTAAEDGLKIEELSEGGFNYYQLTKRTPDVALVGGGQDLEVIRNELESCEKPQSRRLPGEMAVREGHGSDGAKDKNKDKSKNEKAANAVILSLRAPEGIVYYLGELMRQKSPVTSRMHQNLYDCDDKKNQEECKEEAIFAAQEDQAFHCDAIVDVDYEGKRYIVPGGKKPACSSPGRSMQTMSLLSELISLQKSAKDLPTTSVVRVVGQ
jgi:hypothetical protein